MQNLHMGSSMAALSQRWDAAMGSHFGRCSGKVERGGCESLPCQASLCVRIAMESGDEKIAFAQQDTPLTMSIWRKP